MHWIGLWQRTIRPNVLVMFRNIVAYCLVWFMPHQTMASENISFKVAVASNFSVTLKKLRLNYKRKTGNDFSISQASSGKLFSQISYGAPYDMFLSADEKRADLLIQNGMAGNGVVYAHGLLVLLAKKTAVSSCGVSINEVLNNTSGKVAIANPKTAPYGYAAKQVLVAYKQWFKIKPRLVSGENIIQAYQFLMSGSAEVGVLAKSLLHDAQSLKDYCQWEVPEKYYQPIKQKMIVLQRSKNKLSVMQFYHYMQSHAAKKIIKTNGYSIE